MRIMDEELQHVICEMTTKNMYSDLAMLFITLPQMTLDDLFLLEHQISSKFYINVFKYLVTYSKKKIDNGSINSIVDDIIIKLEADSYSNIKEYPNGSVVRNSLIVGYLDNIIEHSYIKLPHMDFLILIDNIFYGKGIATDIMKTLLLKHKHINILNILSTVISKDYFSVSDLLDILVDRNKYADISSIESFINYMFVDREKMIELMYELMKRYKMILGDDGSSYKVTHISNNKSERELYDNIRRMLFNVIYGEADMDLYNFANGSYTRYAMEGDTKRQLLYNKYQLWCASPERYITRVKNFTNNSYEEPDDMFDDNEWSIFSKDVFVKQYIFDIEDTGGFNLFIKGFNVSRLKIFQFNNSEQIMHLVNRIQSNEDAGYFIKGSDPKIYYFLDCKIL